MYCQRLLDISRSYVGLLRRFRDSRWDGMTMYLLASGLRQETDEHDDRYR